MLLISARHFGSWSCLAWPSLINHFWRARHTVLKTRLYSLYGHMILSDSTDDNIWLTYWLQQLGRCQFTVASRSVTHTQWTVISLTTHTPVSHAHKLISEGVKQIPEQSTLQLCFSDWNWAAKNNLVIDTSEASSDFNPAPIFYCWKSQMMGIILTVFNLNLRRLTIFKVKTFPCSCFSTVKICCFSLCFVTVNWRYLGFGLLDIM